ncbi:hypothetical protein WJX72_004306 [[Myrmecia] bisecta]|uniref:USP domain-containing protein n=1 Tax=[Myrmecia] bisecta TaxID=41462 RepID=A0AAW1PCK5_9CHLO
MARTGKDGCCSHLAKYKGKRGAAAWRPVQRSLLLLWRSASATPSPAEPGPAFVCLNCATCSGSLDEHLQGHHKGAGSGHELALDVVHGELFCCACKDYVYDADFDKAVAGARALAAQKVQPVASSQPDSPQAAPLKREPSPDAVTGQKRALIDLGANAEWLPSKQERQSLEQGSTAVPQADAFPTGLRGLNNLGNTCFMNSVLQAMLHAPLLRNYYLAGGHQRSTCPRRAVGPCLSCELDNMFCAAYSGHRRPYSPTGFLYNWWQQAAAHLAGYQQQDAHEFYLNMLNGLMSSVVASLSSTNSATPSPVGTPGKRASGAMRVPEVGSAERPITLEDLMGLPDPGAHAGFGARVGQEGSRGMPDETEGDGRGSSCSASSIHDAEGESIASRVFGGQLQSDVTCSACGYTSSTLESFLDISLDIDPPVALPPPVLPAPRNNPHLHARKHGKAKSANTIAARMAAAAAAAANLQQHSEPAPTTMTVSGETNALTAQPSDSQLLPVTVQPTTSLDTNNTATSHVDIEGSDSDAASDAETGRLRALGPGYSGGPPNAALNLTSSIGAKLHAIRTRVRGQSEAATADVGDADVKTEGHQSHVADASMLGGSTNEAVKTEGHQSHVADASMLGGSTNEAASSAGASSSVAGAGSKRPPAGAKKARVTRCGECHSCRNKHLKKACERNKALRDAGLMPAANPTLMKPSSSKSLQAARSKQRAQSAYGEQSGTTTGYTGDTSALHQATSVQQPPPPQHAQHAQQRQRQELQWPGFQQRQPRQHPPQMQHQAPRDRLQQQVPAGAAQQAQRPASAQQASSSAAQPAQPGRQSSGPAQQPQQAQRGPSPAQQAQQAQRGLPLPPLRFVGPPVPTATSLTGCLHRFVRPEHLGAEGQWLCGRCQTGRHAVKQMSIRKLPPVLCLHIKRFKHLGIGRKLETPLMFPISNLDLRPFMASAVLRGRYGVRPRKEDGAAAGAAEAGGSVPASRHAGLYELYAVVCHSGTLQGGHYIAFVRCGSQWYRCDDAFVTEVDEAEVQSCQAYMLYYGQKALYT